MKKMRLFTLAVLFGLLLQPLSMVQANLPPTHRLPVVTEEANGIYLEWYAPLYTLQKQGVDSIKLDIPGFEHNALPGQWDLPQSSMLAAVPLNANPSFEILYTDTKQAVLPALPNRVAQPTGAVGQLTAPEDIQPADQQVFSFEEVGILRGIRLVRLVYTPLYPVGNDDPEWRFTQEIHVRIRFNTPVQAVNLAKNTTGNQDILIEQLHEEVINPSQIQVEAAPAKIYQPVMQTASTPSFYIEVVHSGLTQLSYQGLLSAGLDPAGLNPHRLQLWKGTDKIAMEWEGDVDDSFEPGERLIFYAELRPSRWTRTDFYRLEVGDVNGTRITSRSADATGLPANHTWFTLPVESNKVYTPHCYCGYTPPGPDGDHWAWEQLSLPGKSTGDYPFQISAMDPLQPARLSVWMVSYTDILYNSLDHHVVVDVNGFRAGEISWNGKDMVVGVFDLPAGVLKEGENSLTLTLPGISGIPVEGSWLDSFQIQYAKNGMFSLPAAFTGETVPGTYTLSLPTTIGLRGYDVTDPANPVRLTDIQQNGSQVILDETQTGARDYTFVTETEILQPEKIRGIQPLRTQATTGATYIIISHQNFLDDLDPLIRLRESQGLTVAVEEVQSIYDTYNGGRPDPQAIHSFLSDAYHRWNPRPVYVLLVGDGNSDPKGNLVNSPATYIPPFLENVDPWAGETASDNRFVTVDGADTLPDMVIGRLPVNSLEQIRAVVYKLTRHELNPVAGEWPQTISFFSDDADRAGDFPKQADLLAERFNLLYHVRRLYYTPPSISTVEMHQRVISDLNQGAGLVIYSGHSSLHQWGEENFFHISQVENLQNHEKLPVVLEMTCFTSSFHIPGLDALDEALLRQPDGGSIASWGSTGLGLLEGHEVLANSFVSTIYQSNEKRLGMATLAGKVSILRDKPMNIDLLDTYTLLGDPATIMNLTPRTKTSYDYFITTVHR